MSFRNTTMLWGVRCSLIAAFPGYGKIGPISMGTAGVNTSTIATKTPNIGGHHFKCYRMKRNCSFSKTRSQFRSHELYTSLTSSNPVHTG